MKSWVRRRMKRSWCLKKRRCQERHQAELEEDKAAELGMKEVREQECEWLCAGSGLPSSSMKGKGFARGRAEAQVCRGFWRARL